MRRGGLIAVAAPSRHDFPELAHALPKTPLTFDAELAPGLLGELFEEPEVKRSGCTARRAADRPGRARLPRRQAGRPRPGAGRRSGGGATALGHKTSVALLFARKRL